MSGRPLLAIAMAALACNGGVFFECPATDAENTAGLPALLSETGLYLDTDREVLAAEVRPYRPTYPFWSDGAVKRRWIAVPAGADIDTRDPDAWVVPTGTRVWKEFSRDGIRVETRLIERREGSWVAGAYLWRSDESDADLRPFGVIDARGTDHDVPAAGECIGCHGGRASFVLGFSAIQLSHPAQADDEWTLERLIDAGRLSDPPPRVITLPGEPTVQAALGYLHSNCGHCHNQSRPADTPCFNPNNRLDFWLRTAALDRPEDTPTYRSAIGDRIIQGRPDDSLVVERMSQRTFIYGMPPLGSERVDETGVALIRQWIVEM